MRLADVLLGKKEVEDGRAGYVILIAAFLWLQRLQADLTHPN